MLETSATRTSTRFASTTGCAAIWTASWAVHVRHAFANLDPERSGAAVDELIPEPRERRSGSGWSELELGRHPDLFFAVHRLEFADAIEDATDGRFHVLNLVEGEEVELETESGDRHARRGADRCAGRDRRLRAAAAARLALQGREGVRPMSGTGRQRRRARRWWDARHRRTRRRRSANRARLSSADRLPDGVDRVARCSA